MKTMTDTGLIPLIDAQSTFAPNNRIKEHVGRDTMPTLMLYPHYGAVPSNPPAEAQAIVGAYIGKVGMRKAFDALQALSQKAQGWTHSQPCTQHYERVYRLAFAYCVRDVLEEANKQLAETQRHLCALAAWAKVTKPSFSGQNITCSVRVNDKVKAMMWGIGASDWVELQEEKEEVGRAEIIPENTATSPEFVWSKSIYQARKAAKEFSKETHADY